MMAPDPKDNGVVPERMDHDAVPPPSKPVAPKAGGKKKKDEKNKDEDLVSLVRVGVRLGF